MRPERTPLGRRGAVALMAALVMPLLLASLALAADLGLWFRELARLQVAADAAAMGAARLLPYDTGAASGAVAADYRSTALREALAATGGNLLGSFATANDAGLAVAVAADRSSLSVTLTSNADLVFASFFVTVAPLSATATAGRPGQNACLVALGVRNLLAAVAQTYVGVAAGGQVAAPGCVVLANPVLAADTGIKVAAGGALSAFGVGAVGQVAFDAGVSATRLLKPTTPAQDPFAVSVASLAVPACGASGTGMVVVCPSTAAQTQWVVPKGTVFTPGTTYYVEGLDLVFDGAVLGAAVSAANVTFVLAPSALLRLPLGITVPARNPGNLVLRNNAGVSLAAGTVPGVAVFQACAPAGLLATPPVGQVAAGSTLALSGAVYAPCGRLSVSGTVSTTAGATASLVVGTLDVAAGGRVTLANGLGGPPLSVSQVTLLK